MMTEMSPGGLRWPLLGVLAGATASAATSEVEVAPNKTALCPPGWAAGYGNKCMSLAAASTHAGCAAACGPNASLACIESQEDEDLAALLAMHSPSLFVWTGEYQWPIEDSISFYPSDCTFAFVWSDEAGTMVQNVTCDLPYKGQQNWGTCTNGRRSASWQLGPYPGSRFATYQPNNFNGGEDCMARSIPGYADNKCQEVFPCLCEWPSRTTDVYVNEHAPVLEARAAMAWSIMLTAWRVRAATHFAYASIPALVFVLFVELYHVRWLQRTAATSPAEKKLKANKRLALRRRMLQSGLSLWMGGAAIAVARTAVGQFVTGMWPMMGFGGQPFGNWFMYSQLNYVGIALIGLSVLPSDDVMTRVLAAGSVAYFVAHLSTMWGGAFSPFQFTISFVGEKELWIAAKAVVCAAGLPPAIFWRRHALPSRIALKWVWVVIRLHFVLDAIAFIADLMFWWNLWEGLDRTNEVYGFAHGAFIATLGIVLTPYVRRRIQGLLGGFGQGAANASAAAVVSTMIGGSAVEALRIASERLRCIRISTLVESDMANNQDSGLFAKTETARVGEVDGFLSHSWRDDAPLKWRAMLKFKKDFEATHGGAEPKCWLDKACIDQSSDINASLKVLPIYLLASKTFVVFAGKSYTSRLWCVVELFAYLRGGGMLDGIVVEPLDITVSDAVGGFDVMKTDCTVRADKQRLLGIIEASFGSTADFNLACRKILLTKLGAAEKPAAAHRQLSMIGDGGAAARAVSGDAPPPEALDC